MSSIQNTNLSGGAKANLMNVPGGPNIDSIASTNMAIKQGQASKDYVVVDGGAQGSNEFPYKPFAADSYDDIANIKANVGGRLVVPFEKEDAEYIMRQKAQIDNANFDRWLMQ